MLAPFKATGINGELTWYQQARATTFRAGSIAIEELIPVGLRSPGGLLLIGVSPDRDDAAS